MVSQMIQEESYVAIFFEDKKMRVKLSAPQCDRQLKDELLAVSRREQGNASFRAGRYTEALRQYGHAVLSAATPDTTSGAHANRSAALFHLEQYQDSLQDMESALSAGYPADRHHKLHVRRARCYLALGRRERARAALTEYRAALDGLKLGLAAREKLTGEADRLCADIERAAETAEDRPEPVPPQKPAVDAGVGTMSDASSCLQLRQTEQKGRHVVTSRAVPKGAVLFAEEPYVCVLLPERRLDHCHHCIRQTHAVLPCLRCRDVGYCSAACRDAAGATYHASECGHAGFLEAFGIGRAAVRVALTAGWRRLAQLRDQLRPAPAAGDTLHVSERCEAARCDCHTPAGDRYLAVFHLMHHLAQCGQEDAYHYSRAAATLAVFLVERTAFFGAAGPPPEWAVLWTAALLLRHILQLVCNAHAPTKLIPVPTEGNVVQLAEERVATAIYTSASYMNHACDPSIINSFWDRALIVRTVKRLVAGEEVFHCYGPHYARAAPSVRRQQLWEQYHFTCDCPNCTRPQLANHLEVLNSVRCLACGGVTLPSAAGGDDGRRCCVACRRSHQYGERRARLESIEAEGEQVASMGDRQSAGQAVSRLDALLKEAKSLAPPTHETLYILHDHRAKLCTHLGEPALALASLRQNLASAEARYGADSVELGNLLLTVTDLLLQSWRTADGAQTRRKLSKELRQLVARGLAIFSIHYGEWSAAYRDLQHKLATVSNTLPPAP